MDTSPIIENTPQGATTPKKYIRTLEGDIEIFKKGGKPDLMPLEKKPDFVKTESPKPPTESLVEPPTESPAKSLVEPPAESPAKSFVEPSAELFTESPTKQFTESAKLPPIQENTPSPIKTYSDDFLTRIKNTNASTASILAVEMDNAKTNSLDDSDKSPSSNILYIISGAVLLILSVISIYFVYINYYAVGTPPTIFQAEMFVPIFVDEREKISNSTKEAVLQAIEQSVVRPLAPNTVRLLYIDIDTTDTAMTIDNNDVFAALQLPAPGILLRNIDFSRNMAGIVNSGGTQSPFFILTVASYGDTFAGMLAWEQSIIHDLSQIFPTPIAADAINVTSEPIVKSAFIDEIVGNHDVRTYRGPDGRTVLMYGYWNRTTLVIARDQSAFMEIVRRLSAARTQP